MENEQLVKAALEARSMSYAPYSKFRVGAALLCEDGTVVKGGNIENSSYGATNCAERTAFFKAVSDGHRKFAKIAIAGGSENTDQVSDFAYPCGICRQVMREFCDKDQFQVIIAKSETEYESYLLEELLPKSFGPENLNR